MRGYLVRGAGGSHVVEVIDLNYGGCGIRVPVPLAPGEQVKLSVLERGSIPGEVRWYKDGRAGIDFSPAERPREKVERQVQRVPVDADVILRLRSRPSYRVPVRDLSTDGCQIEFAERPREGDVVWIKFDTLESLEARVIWVERSTAGLRFDNPIHPTVFEMLLERLGLEP
jgi:hypothetical protein